MGPLVIHLMTAQARSFYELERLWSAAPLISLPEKTR
jgi:ribosomal silencing factor RsfS